MKNGRNSTPTTRLYIRSIHRMIQQKNGYSFVKIIFLQNDGSTFCNLLIVNIVAKSIVLHSDSGCFTWQKRLFGNAKQPLLRYETAAIIFQENYLYKTETVFYISL